MSKIDAYAYYLSAYSSNRPTRYDSHKKSDLRKIYNHMVKTNRESPLYKLTNEDAVAKYAIDIKENAKAIQNVVASLSDNYGEFDDSFQKKVAVSSDEDAVRVDYIGDGTEDSRINGFAIEVKQLSSPQINTGNYMKNSESSIPAGSYSFDLSTNNATYEFQYSIGSADTNLDVLKKIARLVNRSSLGITATIKHGSQKTGGTDTSALSLTSRQTGATDDNRLFEIRPTNMDSIHALEHLGIQKVTHQAENAVFLFNGMELSSPSNSFTIEDVFDVTLKGISEEGHPADVSFKKDVDAVADNVMSLVNVFNNILTIAENTSEEATGDTNKLLNEMRVISRSQRESLGSIGLIVADNGNVSLDKSILEDAIQPEHAHDTFHILTNFKNAVGAKADAVAINPMNYVNKVVINYKNPGRTFTAPYFSSVYSGMILDRYI